MTGLAEWLTVCVDEDEASAWAVHDVAKYDAMLYEEDMAAYAARESDCDCGYPARVLREAAHKCGILDRHQPNSCGECMWCSGEEESSIWPCQDIMGLAEVFSDRPGYQEAISGSG